MEQDDLLCYGASVLEKQGLQYFVTGSMASVLYGEPRFTNDIDIVVQLTSGQVRALCQQFPEDDFYVSEDAAIEAVRHVGMFNVLHPTSGLKIDLIVAGDNPFVRMQLQRRRNEIVGREGQRVWFAAPEDIILNKLQFYMEGLSDKHLRDIAGILKTSRSELDVEYIEKWASQFDVLHLWQSVQRRVAGQ